MEEIAGGRALAEGASASSASTQFAHDLGTGPVLAVPATKTVTAQLSAMVALAAGFGSSPPGDIARCAAAPDARLALPDTADESLQAIVATVRLQQLSLQLALLRGHDPDRPGGLSKVTLTH